MNQLEPIDELRDLWQQAPGEVTDREMNAIWRLVREKDHSQRALVRAKQQTEMAVALVMAPILLLVAYKAKWFWAQMGYGLMGLACLLGVLAIWALHRRDRAEPDKGLEARRYLEEAVRYYDSQVRFLRSIVWWYIAPLMAGLAVFVYAMWQHAGFAHTWAAVLFGVVVPLSLWLAIRRKTLCGVAAWHEKKRQAAELLKEWGRFPTCPVAIQDSPAGQVGNLPHSDGQ